MNDQQSTEEPRRAQTEERSSRRRRGIYLLPNLFTTAGLFAGFFAVILALEGQFHLAAVAIFVAIVTDGLDGRVARMTQTESEFGTHYDSLTDMIAFSIAPALVAYLWVLESLGNAGWLVAFVYTAAGALRLARFNAQVGSADKRYFQGLASPAAAAVVASGVWFGHVYGASPEAGWLGVAGVAPILMVLLALLMVSRIRYHSFKEIELRRRVPFVAVLAVVLVFVLISLDPPQVLFLASLLYAASGPIVTLVQIRRRRLARRRAA